MMISKPRLLLDDSNALMEAVIDLLRFLDGLSIGTMAGELTISLS
jgi:hypothetical protein